MTLELADRVIATVLFSEHDAAGGNGAWIVLTHPPAGPVLLVDRPTGRYPTACHSERPSDLGPDRLTPGDWRLAGDELTRGGRLPRAAPRQTLSDGGVGNLLVSESAVRTVSPTAASWRSIQSGCRRWCLGRGRGSQPVRRDPSLFDRTLQTRRSDQLWNTAANAQAAAG
jgi:hypothetical protein